MFVEFHVDFCLVKDNKTRWILLQRIYKDELYHLRSSNLSPSTLIGEKVNPITWHNRLDHPHFQILQYIIKSFRLPTTHQPQSQIYETYCLSKVHKLLFKLSKDKSIKPLELIHSNIWGPSSISSHYSFNYNVIFIDDLSKHSQLFPLKRKNDVLNIFIEFK